MTGNAYLLAIFMTARVLQSVRSRKPWYRSKRRRAENPSPVENAGTAYTCSVIKDVLVCPGVNLKVRSPLADRFGVNEGSNRKPDRGIHGSGHNWVLGG